MGRHDAVDSGGDVACGDPMGRGGRMACGGPMRWGRPMACGAPIRRSEKRRPHGPPRRYGDPAATSMAGGCLSHAPWRSHGLWRPHGVGPPLWPAANRSDPVGCYDAMGCCDHMAGDDHALRSHAHTGQKTRGFERGSGREARPTTETMLRQPPAVDAGGQFGRSTPAAVHAGGKLRRSTPRVNEGGPRRCDRGSAFGSQNVPVRIWAETGTSDMR